MRYYLLTLSVLFLLLAMMLTKQPVNKQREHISKFIQETYKISNAKPIVDYVFEVSERKNIDPTLVLGIIATESGFNSDAKSKAKALGLMQVHYPAHKNKVSNQSELYDIQTNIDIGTDIWIRCVNRSKDLSAASKCYSGGHKQWLSKVKSNQTKFIRIYDEHSESNTIRGI